MDGRVHEACGSQLAAHLSSLPPLRPGGAVTSPSFGSLLPNYSGLVCRHTSIHMSMHMPIRRCIHRPSARRRTVIRHRWLGGATCRGMEVPVHAHRHTGAHARMRHAHLRPTLRGQVGDVLQCAAPLSAHFFIYLFILYPSLDFVSADNCMDLPKRTSTHASVRMSNIMSACASSA